MMQSLRNRLLLLSLLGGAGLSQAELQSVDDAELAAVSGQGGIYLSGDITINEHGGPLADPASEHWGDCSETIKRCGGRVTMQPSEDGGWFVLDDIRGNFSFQGLTLRSRHIGPDDTGFGGDAAEFDRDVLEIGLPDVVKMRNVQFTFGTSNYARPTDPNFHQTNVFTFQLQGDVTMQGNLLVFPTGTP